MSRRLAIAGSTGFLGGALLRAAAADPRFETFPLPRQTLNDSVLLTSALENADSLLYFAGQSRGEDGDALYRENMMLAFTLAEALTQRASDRRLTVYFASTTHDAKDFPYHASKRDGAELLRSAAAVCYDRISTVILRLPNVFGPGGRPFFNSAVATFVYQAAHHLEIHVNPGSPELKLIHLDTVVQKVLDLAADPATPTGVVTFDDEFSIPVEACANLCRSFADGYTPAPDAPRFEQLLYRQYCAVE